MESPYLFHVLVHYSSSPASIASHLERIMRGFLWSNNETGSGFNQVIGEKFVVPNKRVGYAIRPLLHMNEAFNTKCL